MAKKKPLDNSVLPGSRYRATHKASVVGILGELAPRVESKGTQFYNRNRWTCRVLITHLCDWAKANPLIQLSKYELERLVNVANSHRIGRDEQAIVIAQTPDKLPRDMALALIGGGYHEAWHTQYSCTRNLSFQEIANIVVPRWGKVQDWSKFAGILLEWSNIIEDIRIERLGCKEYPGTVAKMHELQDFVLRQEMKSRLENPDDFNSFAALSCAFRDMGLGYNTEIQAQAMKYYIEKHTDAVRLIESGPLRRILDEAIALDKKDDTGCLRLALDVVIELTKLSQQQPPAPPQSEGAEGEGEGQNSDSQDSNSEPQSGNQNPNQKESKNQKSNKNDKKSDDSKRQKPQQQGDTKESGKDKNSSDDKKEKETEEDDSSEGSDSDDSSEDKSDSSSAKNEKEESDSSSDDSEDGEDGESEEESDEDEDESDSEDGEENGESSDSDDSSNEEEGDGSDGGGDSGSAGNSESSSESGSQGQGGSDSQGSGGELGNTENPSESETPEGGGDGAGGHNHATGESNRDLAQEILDQAAQAQERGETGTKNYAQLMENTISEITKDEMKDCRSGEKPWRPYTLENDEVRIIKKRTGDDKKATLILNQVREEARYLRARFRTLLRSMEIKGTTHGLRRGKGVSERFLVDSKAALQGGALPKRAYYDEDETIDMSLAAAVVIDESGSMSGRLSLATAIMMAITEPLDSLGCKVQVSGFRDGRSAHVSWQEHREAVHGGGYHRTEGIIHDVFKTFEEPFRNVKSRFANTMATGGTPMSDGVQFGLDALNNRQEAHRILFIITDGCPNGDHRPVINHQLRLAKDAGIHIIGVGIGSGASYVQSLFPDSVYHPQVSELPKLLVSKLNELIEIRNPKRGRRMRKSS